MPKYERKTVWLQPKLNIKLRKFAKKQLLSESEVVRLAVVEFIK